ncbi:recombinase family protein [Kocuria rhizophila]|uniref:recombinase family protein n=1 Tax=Kocuria rhizophila TaxID=72000 RepID=UPI001ADC4685|nr:recombinase family protein [Kocuria rhizophila]QTK32343.1 recombinase family protein [Kocuria rhizophila]
MDAVIYARISRDTEGTQLGVNRQLEDCRQAASARRWTVVHEYVENDTSATRAKVRPQYQQMLRDLANGIAGALIVWDVDRLTRTPRELEDVIDLADAHNIALVSIGGEIDLATPQGRMTARIKGSVARHETDQMARRIRRKQRERAEQGLPNGLCPFGWRRVYDDQVRRAGARDVAYPPEADQIRDGVSRLLAGESVRSIALRWNTEGLPTQRGNGWRTGTVRQTLRRAANAGLREHKGEIFPSDVIEPLITEDELHRVRALLADPGRRVHHGTTPAYLLTGIAECGRCGGKMRYLKSRGRDGMPSYGCRDCTRVARSMGLVDAVVEGAVLGRLQRPDVLETLPTMDPKRGDDLRSQAATLEAKLSEAADLFTAGTITGEQLSRITAGVRPQLERTRAQLADLTPASAAAAIAGEDAVARWEDATLLVKREIVDTLMTVTILPAGPGRGRDPESVEIEWKS